LIVFGDILIDKLL